MPLGFKISIGVLVCSVALWITWGDVRDIRKAWRLSEGTHTTGEVTSVDEEIEDCDACPGRIRRMYATTYQFSTESGHTIKDSITLGYHPEGQVDVIYNPSNPRENRLADARQTTVVGAVILFIIKFGMAIAVIVMAAAFMLDFLEARGMIITFKKERKRIGD